MTKVHSFPVLATILTLLLLNTHRLVSSGENKIHGNPQEQQYLKILSWNIYMLPYGSLINHNVKRAKAIANQIPKFDYDIVIFEEAFDRQARVILKKVLKNYFPYNYGPVNKLPYSFRINSGIWVFSKIPLRSLSEIEFQTCYGIDKIARKGAVLLEGIWHEQRFQLVCTHLQANSPDHIRHQQCMEIKEKLLGNYTVENVPQIICGDFNIEMDDQKNYRNMLTILDSDNGILAGEIQTSYDEVDNELAQKKDGKKQLIDYILIRNKQLVNSISRRILVLKEYKDKHEFNLSDHYGIEASIQFKQN
ncbi:MAG: sphingomyelin phosphodiesterase [Bacteroidales bacterium]|nr:sphingomyelin phosphodiesterase [Bacteroidales bacterium]